MCKGMSTAISCIVLTVGFLWASRVQAQEAEQQSAPIPAPILNAKKVFIANGGADALLTAHDQENGVPGKHYSQFYVLMRKWAFYEVVTSPADADLVLETYASAPVESVSNGKSRIQPQFQVSIFDCKTHFLLWRLTESLDPASPGMFGGVENVGNDKFDLAVSGVV